MNQKNSKIALVTGGNRGIGLAIALVWLVFGGLRAAVMAQAILLEM
jgi:NAD(P)-dependent dehydrogenase (short-subunit alcohol dehydrogenase family)